ncbi:MAG: acetyltransferase [Rhizobiales bacterium NRL2]|jgi:hypothetical protein|nr:MAG: acetyltransferase [Rhizobiales bacterium NRL2]
MEGIRIEEVDAAGLQARLDGFTEVLHAAVQAGANVNFIWPFPREEAEAFWRMKVLPPLRAGGRILWAALDGEQVCGTVQLLLDMPPNQRHRGEVTKLLVHPGWRRRGIGRALMAALDAKAAALGRTLVTLDTRTGDAAQPLYAAAGYRVAGEIPRFAMTPEGGRYDATTYMYKLFPADRQNAR